MGETVWKPVLNGLDRLAERGRVLDVWLRDDDAITVTPALQRLAAICDTFGMPVLLAVIPEPADRGLARFVERHPLFTPTQHGFRHANLAPAGEKARELGRFPSREAVLNDLRGGRAKMADLFGEAATDILVPPWNRIDDELIPGLPAIGFKALSTFGPAPDQSALPRLNCDLDPIDWRNGKVCRPHDRLVRHLAELIAERTIGPNRPLGLLTHHLAHDEGAWAFCEAALACFIRHPAVRFVSADDLLERDGSSERSA